MFVGFIFTTNNENSVMAKRVSKAAAIATVAGLVAAVADVKLTPEQLEQKLREDREYAVAVVAKQADVSAEEAEAIVAKLEEQPLAQLVMFGRSGLIEQCRELLGLE